MRAKAAAACVAAASVGSWVVVGWHEVAWMLLSGSAGIVGGQRLARRERHTL